MASIKHHAHHRFGTGETGLHRTAVQTFALVLGAVFLTVGVLGFVPGLVSAPGSGPALSVDAFHGRLLGLFPVNLLHNLVHLGVGLLGIVAARSWPGSVRFARGLAIFYGLLAVLGLIPATETLFGLVPIHSHDIWLHAGTALIAAWFGFGRPAAPESGRVV